MPSTAATSTATATSAADSPPAATRATPTRASTISFAGDVHFSGRVAERLAADPQTVFGEAATGLGAADLTVVNLETAIATGGQPVNKAFTFRAPPSALTALRAAGVDVATMANNHGADFGAGGLAQTFAAVTASGFPVIGIGADAAAAYAPYTTTLGGQPVAIMAADQVDDETTLRLFSAGAGKPGVANARLPAFLDAVRATKAAGYTVIVYLHWGTEYDPCPDPDQRRLTDQLAAAGASAIIGTHAHVLQGAGWRADGVYVAYGLGNYLWWRSFGNDQDDNGVLTVQLSGGRVVAADFAASHLDERGVPVPATGEQQRRIDAQWEQRRQCAGLSATPP